MRAPVELALVLIALSWALPAAAQDTRSDAGASDPPSDPHAHLFGALAIGRGIRLNNPYRLATPLGDTAESLSLSATYLDLSLGAAIGAADGIAHGGALHLSVATEGVPQEVITPSYVALHRFADGWIAYGRAGIPIVLEPDVNAGFELAAGGAWLLSAGLGVTAELVGSVFYGAATHDESVTIIPIVSLQIGVLVDYEILP